VPSENLLVVVVGRCGEDTRMEFYEAIKQIFLEESTASPSE
jgi:hypothetical protein